MRNRKELMSIDLMALMLNEFVNLFKRVMKEMEILNIVFGFVRLCLLFFLLFFVNPLNGFHFS